MEQNEIFVHSITAYTMHVHTWATMYIVYTCKYVLTYILCTYVQTVPSPIQAVCTLITYTTHSWLQRIIQQATRKAAVRVSWSTCSHFRVNEKKHRRDYTIHIFVVCTSSYSLITHSARRTSSPHVVLLVSASQPYNFKSAGRRSWTGDYFN